MFPVMAVISAVVAPVVVVAVPVAVAVVLKRRGLRCVYMCSFRGEIE